MELAETLHLAAGAGAAAFGCGALIGGPRRSSTRAFGLLCAALALWNLGYSAYVAFDQVAWLRPLFLFGSFAAAPLGLDFAMAIADVGRRSRLRALIGSAIPAALVWVGAWTSFADSTAWWLSAIFVTGVTLLVALVTIGLRMRRLDAGPERLALALVFGGGLVAAVGGVTDFLPRERLPLIDLGPPTLLLFLLVLCAVVMRHRFLDVGVFFLRAVALLGSATVMAIAFYFVVQSDVGRRYSTLLVVSIAILAIVAPFGRRLLTRAEQLIATQDPVVQALLEASRKVSVADSIEEIWRSIRDAARGLAGHPGVTIHTRGFDGEVFTAWAGDDRVSAADLPSFRAAEPLPRWLGKEGLPVTARYLDRERVDAIGRRAGDAELVGKQLATLDARIVVPLAGTTGLVGWIAVTGDFPERYLTGNVASAFLSLAHQATAAIERVQAVDRAKRKEALAAVGELAAGLAHEIRNPVSAIRGATQALGPEASPEQRKEMLEVIDEESERLGRFVGEFLDYARPHSPRARRLDVAELTRRSLDRMAVAGMSPQAEIEIDAPHTEIVGDSDQLVQVVENLVRNAFEAVGREGRLSVRIENDRQGLLTLRFRDDGPGIAREDLGRIFQPFHTTKPSGTGLGLATVERIVQAHGGTVGVAAGGNGGAEFILTLPLAPAERDGEQS